MDMAGGQRLNPPPGWPPAPAGWTPPPGWAPPADWPPLPPGWQLWLPATGSAPSAPPVRAGALPWYRRTWGTLLLLVVFFPAGLFLMWRRQSWGRGTKWSLTAATALVVLIALATGGSSPPTSSANLATLTTPASTAAPVTSSAQLPSLPTTAVAPSTSHNTAAARVTTTAPVVRPAPSSQHTSRSAPTSVAAPSSAPVPGCYPLTNGGNCYQPGEFCRKSDHGAYGVAGNGERIVCAYNNGWRWEPV